MSRAGPLVLKLVLAGVALASVAGVLMLIDASMERSEDGKFTVLIIKSNFVPHELARIGRWPTDLARLPRYLSNEGSDDLAPPAIRWAQEIVARERPTMVLLTSSKDQVTYRLHFAGRHDVSLNLTCARSMYADELAPPLLRTAGPGEHGSRAK